MTSLSIHRPMCMLMTNRMSFHDSHGSIIGLIQLIWTMTVNCLAVMSPLCLAKCA